MSSFRSTVQNTISLARYNMRIIFGGKFVYFILAAFIFFLVFGTITALESSDMNIDEVYGLLAFPAILLVFFPSVFGIQSDADQRTLEIIFGIPDYRYKVWLVRYLMIHELCHARHMNHSRRFWRAVARHEPDYKQLDRELGESWSRVPGWLCLY